MKYLTGQEFQIFFLKLTNCVTIIENVQQLCCNAGVAILLHMTTR